MIKRLSFGALLAAALLVSLPASAVMTVDSQGGCRETTTGLQVPCGLGPYPGAIGNQNPVVAAPAGPTRTAVSLSAISGTIAAGQAGASPFFTLRFTPAVTTDVLVCRKVQISAGDLVGFTAGFVNFQLFAARAYTVSATGGTASTLTTNNGKLRTSFTEVASTDIGDFRMVSTTVLTAGTRTLDATPLATLAGSVAATAGAPIFNLTNLFDANIPGQEPIILANNEGIELVGTVPATGTWQLGVNVQCDVMSAF